MSTFADGMSKVFDPFHDGPIVLPGTSGFDLREALKKLPQPYEANVPLICPHCNGVRESGTFLYEEQRHSYILSRYERAIASIGVSQRIASPYCEVRAGTAATADTLGGRVAEVAYVDECPRVRASLLLNHNGLPMTAIRPVWTTYANDPSFMVREMLWKTYGNYDVVRGLLSEEFA